MNSFVGIILFCLLQFCRSDELVAVTTLIRHGERMPLSFYPTDPYANYSWPFPLGDLSENGVKQSYDFGKWLRKRYHKFLSETYKPNEIFVHSADFPRCLLTAEMAMAGLYPPQGEQNWNPHLNWQPIPIHSSPRSQDIVADMLNPCPSKIEAEGRVIENLPFFPALAKEIKPLIDYIDQHAGERINVTTLYVIFNNFFNEKALGLKQPEWVEKIYDKILPYVILYTKLDSFTFLEKKVQSGPILTKILNQFDSLIKGRPHGVYRKLMTYFTTEWALYDFNYALNMNDVGILGYGAAFMIELRRKSDNYYVNLLWKPSAIDKLRKWPIKGQKFDMEYGQFKRYVEPFLTNTKEWLNLCGELVGDNKSKVIVEVPMT